MTIKESNNQARPAQTAYLIRCWREADTWRFSMEDIALRRRWRYDSVAALLEGLKVQLFDFVASRAR